MTMDDVAVDEIVNLWASNSRTRKNLENPDVNYFAVSSVKISLEQIMSATVVITL